MSHEQMLLEKKENKPEYFDVITEAEINEFKRELKEEFDIDLSNISINILHPGDMLYEHYEIQQALFLKCNSDFGKMVDLIIKHGYDPNDLKIDQFKDIAQKESIVLEGKFPGFAMTSGDDEIIFLGMKEENVIEMAEKYALKEGKEQIEFSDIGEAKGFLKSMGKKYFLHEAGHVVYKRFAKSLQTEWDSFVEKYPDLKNKVIELQKDKYNNDEQIPISEEVFADFFIDVASRDEMISRLGENKEASEMLRALITKHTAC